jgi:riboflavin biosynthesis pyrimidine reductase
LRNFDAVNRLITIEDCSSRYPVTAIGNAWSLEYFDGPFYVFDPPQDLPAISLVFVQSADGNTGADDPSSLGGGATDLHLLYEGLSRVAADAVMAGASSAGPGAFFTVHHPQLVALRLALGLPRHPAQIVLSRHGRSGSADRILLSGVDCDAFARLRRDRGIRRISCIGGSQAATSLVDAGLVQDIYLTTSAIDGGEPNTPWYTGTTAPSLSTIVRKREDSVLNPILFEHLAIGAAPGAR